MSKQKPTTLNELLAQHYEREAQLLSELKVIRKAKRALNKEILESIYAQMNGPEAKPA